MARAGYVSPRQLSQLQRQLQPANRLICEIARKTGLRVGDIVALKSGQLAGCMEVVEAKTGKIRTVRLQRDLLRALRAQSGSVYVFPSRCSQQRHRTRQAVYRDLRKCAQMYGYPRDLTVHSLRKLYAVDLYTRTHDLEAVRRDLGHTYVSTTMLYAFADKISRPRRGGKKNIDNDPDLV